MYSRRRYKPKRYAKKRVYSRALVPRRYRGRFRRSGNYGRFVGSRPELKYFDTSVTGAILQAGSVFDNSINNVPQGTEAVERIGRKITIKSIQLNGALTVDKTIGLAVSTQVVSIWLVLDTQANGAVSTAAITWESSSVYAFKNVANAHRFRVLKKWRYHCNTTGQSLDVAGTGFDRPSHVYPFKFYKKCNIPIEFDGTMGAMTEIRSNNVYLVGKILSTAPAANITYLARIRFSDN